MPALVTIPNVPIVSVGDNWPAQTGPVNFTRDECMSMAAATDDPLIPKPRLKLTLMDDTHGVPITEPAFGRVTNMRFDEPSQTIYGDYEGVPEWLADVLPAAYPNRSVETYVNLTTANGFHSCVIGAVQLLGVEWPGCTVLADLPLYFGKDQPKTVSIKLGGTPMAKLAVGVEDIRRAYYDQLDGQGNYSWWIKQVFVEPDQLVVEDEWESKLYLVDFTIGKDEAIEFNDPREVKIEYVPIEAEAKAAFVNAFADGMATGRKVLASYRSSRDAGRVIKASKGGEGMTEEQRKAAASKLGLPEDATVEQVQAKLLENALADKSTEGTEDKTKEKEEVEIAGVKIEVPAAGTVQHDGAQPQAPLPVAASSGLTVSMDKQAHEQLVSDAAMGRAARQEQVKSMASAKVEEAVMDGRIAPASREAWLSAVFDERNCRLVDSEVAVLAGLAKGRIPVDERGTGGGGSDDPSQVSASAGGEAYPTRWFPEIAQRKSAAAAAQAAGVRVFSEVV